MSEYIDPFAEAPVDEAQAVVEESKPEPEPVKKATAKAAPKKAGTVTVDVKPNLLPLDEGKVTITFKGDGQKPWIVIHAKDVEDALSQVSGDNATTLAALMERVQHAGKHFASLSPAASAGSQQRQSAPVAAQQPPAGSPPSPGPGWVYKTGVTKSGPKAGQPWQGWMPPDAEKAAGAKPVWF